MFFSEDLMWVLDALFKRRGLQSYLLIRPVGRPLYFSSHYIFFFSYIHVVFQFKLALIKILLCHHLSILADLERKEELRVKSFEVIDSAIAYFTKVSKRTLMFRIVCFLQNI